MFTRVSGGLNWHINIPGMIYDDLIWRNCGLVEPLGVAGGFLDHGLWSILRIIVSVVLGHKY